MIIMLYPSLKNPRASPNDRLVDQLGRVLFLHLSEDFKDQTPVVIRELMLRKICCVMTLSLGRAVLPISGSWCRWVGF